MLNTVIDSAKVTGGITLMTVYNIKSDHPQSGGMSDSSEAGLSREDVFKRIDEAGINLDMISQTPNFGGEIILSFTLDDGDLTKALEIMRGSDGGARIDTKVSSGNIEVSLTGSKMTYTPGVAAKVFDEFSRCGISIILITTSDISISCLVANHDEIKLLRLLEDNGLNIEN